MYESLQKKENRSRAVANSVTQKKSNVRQNFGFVDNRPAAIVQQKISTNNPQIKHPEAIQLEAIQPETIQPETIHSKAMQPMGHKQQDSSNDSTIQRVEKTTSIYSREVGTNRFHKGMEIVDSTSAEAYVHISRTAPEGENTVNIQDQPGFFNGVTGGNKRSRINEEDEGAHANLGAYTLANNAHITLEGRYALVMSQLATGFSDLVAIKAGKPVADGFANLNFGSYVDHGSVQKSQKDLFTYISDYAEDATEFARSREEDFEGQKDELIEQIDAVENETAALASTLINNSPLKNLPEDDFVHYGGEPWDPIIPDNPS